MNDNEIKRYAFFTDFVKESSEEELINKLIELDNEHNEREGKIEQLESIIDEAIEYIERCNFIREQVVMIKSYDMQDFQTKKVKELLEILRRK